MSVTTACIRCNSPLDTGARFCQVCGLSVSGEQTAPLPTLLQLLRQATLGEYEILQEIGQGGMATVYLAHEIALDRKVAIKVMSPQFVHGAEMIERFKREARLSAGLNHAHIIPIYAVRESQQLLFFVMKYISGRSLDAILRDVGPLPFPMVRSILADVGSALDYAHRQGVVHRDVKPGNIMIDEEGFAVITDFGIARAAQGEALTRSGTTVGTPSYLSPEACSGEPVGPPADQYSLGIVAYEMITGQLPFSADSSLGMMYAQVHARPRPSQQLRPDCPPDLREAVMRMLEKSPADRFPTLRDAVAALAAERISGGHGAPEDNVRSHIGLLAAPRPSRPVAEVRRTPSSPGPLPHVSPRPAPRKRRRLVRLSEILIGLLLAAVGAGVAYVTLLSREDGLATTPPDSTAPPADQPADSLLLVARGAADYARQRALAVGIDSAALRAGDSLMAIADSLSAAGRKAEAAIVISKATNVWTPGERPQNAAHPATDSGAAVTPAPATQTPPTGLAATDRPASAPRSDTPAPALSDSAAIVQFYTELARAIEARQLGEVRRLLPNMSESDERNWRSLFEDRNNQGISAYFQVRAVTRHDPVTAYARVYHTLTVTRSNGKVEQKQRGLEFAVLTLGPQGWREIRSEKAN
jgi:serine/threonine protein kinase